MTQPMSLRTRTLLASTALGLGLAASGCWTYAAPETVESAIERSMGVELQREAGLDLGPVSNHFMASIAGDDTGEFDFRDFHRIRVAVYEVTRSTGAGARSVTARDLGVPGWSTILSSRDGEDQVLVLARPHKGEIREVMLLCADGDEVTVARLQGHLDRLIRKALDANEREGTRGARAALSVGD
jgi:hypothetical protein